MATKSSSKSTSTSKTSSKKTATSKAAPAQPPRVVSHETADDSDDDMASADGASDQARPKQRLIADDSSSESGSSSSEEEDDDEDTVQQGTSNSSNYLAPRNMQKVVVASGSDFDYAKLLANPALQLYTVRLPDNVKTKSLEKLSLSVNSSGAGLVGSLSTKAGEFVVKAADPQGAAEELKNLRLMLPDARSSTYRTASRELSGALSLNPIVPIASSSTLPPSSTSAPRSRMYVPPPKPPRLQPVDKMRFRNAAFGGGAELAPVVDDDDAPAPAAVVVPEAAAASTKEGKAEKKSKKRKEVDEAGEGKEKKKKKKKTE